MTTTAPTLRGARVTLRPWVDADLAPFAALNADPAVMRHFPSTRSREQSEAEAGRIRDHLAAHGYGLWALDVPALGFVGFVGLTSSVPFPLALPGVLAHPREIGWRLATQAWGQGFATEAARLALDHARRVLGWPQVVSFTALTNAPSQAVMQRIGMRRLGEFDHPRIDAADPLCRHVLYVHDAPTDAALR